MSTQFWRRGAKFAVFLDIIYCAAVFLAIVGLAAVEVAEQRLEKRQKFLEAAHQPPNATDTTIQPEGNPPVQPWKLWAAAVTTFLLTLLHIWCSGWLFRGASKTEHLESARRKAVIWILLKILLDIVEISMNVIIFKAYLLIGIGIVVRLFLVGIIAKYAKEVKAAINAE